MKSTQDIIEGDEPFLNLDPITLGAILTGLGKAGASAYDSKKRRELEAAIAKENAATQRKLAEELAKAKTEADKIRLLDSILAKARRRKNMPLYIAGGILGIGLIIGVILIVKKK
jgi:hypothetical protein